MSEQMRAARLHEFGKNLHVDIVEKPKARSGDVLVKVMACGIIPNFRTALNPPPTIIRPVLPAIYGLDAAGIVVEVGADVRGVEVGKRVYVNPARYCMNCSYCRKGRYMSCDYAALNGYIGSGPKSAQSLIDYPIGGLAEYMTAPPYSLVDLPDNLSFEMAARWGYLGTAYAALKRGGVNMTTSVLINGVSGTMGLGATLFALALGVPKILGTGRNVELLQRVKAIAPDRIHVHSTTESDLSIEAWARSLTDGIGADVVIDALKFGSAPKDFLAAAAALARGGTHVNPGGVFEKVLIDVFELGNKDQSLEGSFWFTPAQGQEMANLAGARMVDLDVFDHRVFPLEEVNTVLDLAVTDSVGGFTNYVINPSLQ